MKKTSLLFTLLISLFFGSCQFNQSVDKDLTTGAYSRGDGLGCGNVTIQINEKVEKRNKFVYGEKVNLVFNNISGLTNIDGLVYPGLSMLVIKNEKDTVSFSPNLLESLNEGTALSPLQLQANFRTTYPFLNDEKYKVYINIWDKKGEGVFTYELPFTVKKNNLLGIEKKGISCPTIYLWDETTKQPVFNKNVDLEHLYILILENIEGLDVINEKVFPIFSIEIVDNKGGKILSNPNMLSAYETEGVDPEAIKSQLTAKINFTKGKVNNPCMLRVKLKDKNSDKEINVSAELIIN